MFSLTDWASNTLMATAILTMIVVVILTEVLVRTQKGLTDHDVLPSQVIAAATSFITFGMEYLTVSAPPWVRQLVFVIAAAVLVYGWVRSFRKLSAISIQREIEQNKLEKELARQRS